MIKWKINFPNLVNVVNFETITDVKDNFKSRIVRLNSLKTIAPPWFPYAFQHIFPIVPITNKKEILPPEIYYQNIVLSRDPNLICLSFVGIYVRISNRNCRKYLQERMKINSFKRDWNFWLLLSLEMSNYNFDWCN